MFRPLLVIIAFLSVAGAQTPSTTQPVPISVMGYLTWPLNSEPELSMTVQNTTPHGIQGYLYQVIFTDPISGEVPPKHEGVGCYRSPKSGVVLAAGAEVSVLKPVPITASGIPANYSFNIDLVLFDDGTTWGPAKTFAARTLLKQVAAFAVIGAASKSK